MKKLFKVSLPQTLLFEDLDQAVQFAKLLADAKTTSQESVYSENARDGRWHIMSYIKWIDLNINFSTEAYYENKWEVIEKLAMYTASTEEMDKRNAMEKEERAAYMKNIVATIPAMADTDFNGIKY